MFDSASKGLNKYLTPQFYKKKIQNTITRKHDIMKKNHKKHRLLYNTIRKYKIFVHQGHHGESFYGGGVGTKVRTEADLGGPWEPKSARILLLEGPWERKSARRVLLWVPWEPRSARRALLGGPWVPRSARRVAKVIKQIKNICKKT